MSDTRAQQIEAADYLASELLTKYATLMPIAGIPYEVGMAVLVAIVDAAIKFMNRRHDTELDDVAYDEVYQRALKRAEDRAAMEDSNFLTIDLDAL